MMYGRILKYVTSDVRLTKEMGFGGCRPVISSDEAFMYISLYSATY